MSTLQDRGAAGVIASLLVLSTAMACEDSTSGADHFALDTDASASVDGGREGGAEPTGPDAGRSNETPPTLPACSSCAVKSCGETLTACGEACVGALVCLEACETVSCQEACLRDVDLAAAIPFKACLGQACVDACPASKLLALGVSAYVTAHCNRYADCGPADLQYNYGTIANCQSRLLSMLAWQAFLPGTGATGFKYADCASETAALSCTDFFSARREFACPIRGKRALGEPCAAAAQCESGFCPTSGFACGTCAGVPADGAACATGGWCGWGMVCTAENKCAHPARAGETCSAAKPCEQPFYCNGTCQLAPSTAGAACGATGTPPYCNELVGYYCASGSCKAYSSGGAGAACGAGTTTDSLCQHGTTCSASRCAKAPAVGEACDNATGPTCTAPDLCIDKKCTALSPPTACK